MNTPEEIQKAISNLVPGASISLDSADTPTGSSWLDITFGGQQLTIECKPSFGFGLYSSNDNSFGSGPNEIYRNIDSLLIRISMLLIEHRQNINLKELRELSGITQVDFSDLSGQKQPSISKLENRNDMQLSTIKKFVNALGGSLEIKAHFNGFDVPIDLSSSKKL